MIIRIRKRHNPYVQIDKRPLEDSRLSLKAKGLLAYLLSRPDDWEVRIEQLSNLGPDGITAVQSALQELKQAGYAALEQVRSNDQHRAAGKRWVVYEELLTTRFSDSQKTCPSGNLTVRKPTATNKEEETEKEFSLISPQVPNAPAAPALRVGKRKRESGKYEIPTGKDHEALCDAADRRYYTPWSPTENRALSELRKAGLLTDENLTLVKNYYEASKTAGGHHRRDLLTLLNNFTGEVDRARLWEKSPKTYFRNGSSSHHTKNTDYESRTYDDQW